MYGIELTELLLFGKQLGIALAGAAALWGFILSLKDFHCGTDRACIIYDWIAVRMLPLFLGGVAIGTFSYIGLLSTVTVTAHEGISYIPSTPEVVASFSILTPLFTLLLGITVAMLFVPNKSGNLFANWVTYFYLIAFVLCFLITSFPGWRGVLDGHQLFYIGHGFHSIFTLGSVIVLDYLFLLSRRANILKEHIFAVFPTISAVVWVGLAFDFLSVLFIIEGFDPTTKMLFMQTVIGILIINGVLLSGPIARKMLASVRPSGEEISDNWELAASIAGVVSISSWMTITFIDSFANLPFSYLEFMGLYVLLIGTVFAGHMFVEWLEDRKRPPEFMHK